MESNGIHYETEQQVESIGELYHHVIVYLSVMALLCIVDISDGGNWWCYWPAIGWGACILLNLFTIRSHGNLNCEWEEMEAQKMMRSTS